MRKFHLFLLYAVLLAIVLGSAVLPTARADDGALSTSGRLDLGSQANLWGGLQSRAASSALLQWGGSLDTGAAHWWPGGLIEFSIEGVRSDGNLPSRTGAIQYPNIEWAPNFLRMYQLTYRQRPEVPLRDWQTLMSELAPLLTQLGQRAQPSSA